MKTITQKNKLSNLACTIEGSVTMSITALANQMKADGKDVIGMSAGEPDFDTPNFIKQAAIDAIHNGKTKYTPASGIPELRKAVAHALLRDHGLAYSPSQIVISCGAKHSIFNIFSAILNPGDELIIPSPYWVSYPEQAKLLGAKSVFIQTTDKHHFKISPSQLEQAITSKTKAVILNSPSNPTGVVYTKEELKALAKVIVKHGIYVISDEIYDMLIYDGTHTSIASLGDDINRLSLLVNGMSKAYSMTGWRIGYVALPEEMAKTIGRVQSHTTSNPCSIAQWASIAALQHKADATSEMKQVFEERRNIMISRLNDIDGIHCVTPQGAFYAFPNIQALIGKTSPSGHITDSISFCERLLEDKQVACVPGSAFGADGYIRLSYATSLDDIQHALDRLKSWILNDLS